MEQERINQIVAEKEAGDELRRMGVEIDLGDHRTRVEILAFIRERMGAAAIEQACQMRGRGILKRAAARDIFSSDEACSSIRGTPRV